MLVRRTIEDPDILIKPSPIVQSASSGVLRLLQEASGENLELSGAHGRVQLPKALTDAIGRLCRYLSSGAGATIVPYHAELTTQAAANLLGISRTRLIQLIDRGDLGARKEGTHRRLRLDEVVSYRHGRAGREKVARRNISQLVAGTPGGKEELDGARRHADKLKLGLRH